MRFLPLFLVLAACSGPTSTASTETATAEAAPSEATPTAEAPAPSPAPPGPGPTGPVRLVAPSCGYGGSATAVAIFVDVEADVALTGIHASAVANDPGTGARLGTSSEPSSLYAVPAAHSLADFSTSGTTAFDGTLDAGEHARLLFFAGLYDLASATGPLELVLTLTADGGQSHEVHCTTDSMWPSS